LGLNLTVDFLCVILRWFLIDEIPPERHHGQR